MAGSAAGSTYQGGGTQQQIIGGQSYTMYSPQWYAATDAQRIKDAGTAGTAQGTGAGAEATTYLDALKKTGLPLFDSGGGASSSSTSTGTGAGTGSPFTPPATVPPPSLSGLASAGGGNLGNDTRIFHDGPGTSGSGAHIPGITPVDTSAAQAAAFAHAKDQVGQVGQGALTGLRSALGSRGMLGSGAESRGVASVANRGQGELGDVARSQAVDASALAERTATTNYNGSLTQRTQDITSRGQDLNATAAQRALEGSLAATGYTGAITQRGQDILAAQAAADRTWAQQQASTAQRNAMLQGLLGALGGSGRTY